jgi:spermidine/putrescine transport system permease protein
LIGQFAKKVYLTLIIFFLYLPVCLLVIYSFNDAQYTITWQRFSWHWFIALCQDQTLLGALKNSLFLGFLATSISTLISVLACSSLILNKNHRYLKRFLMLPSFLLILPDLILGVGFLIILNLFNIPFGFYSLLIAHITFCLPFVIFSVINKLHHFNFNLYFAALDLGASKSQAWVKIIIPQILPAILSAFLLGFTLSFDDIMISYFVAGPEYNILPLTIIGMIRSGSTPELKALCSITLFISLFFIILMQRKLKTHD